MLLCVWGDNGHQSQSTAADPSVWWKYIILTLHWPSSAVCFTLRLYQAIPHRSGSELYVQRTISGQSCEMVIRSGSQSHSEIICCFGPDHNLCGASCDPWDGRTLCLHSVSEKWKLSAIYVHRHNGQYRWDVFLTLCLALFFFEVSTLADEYLFQWVIFVACDMPSVLHWIFIMNEWQEH